jgi:hypothetical protein
MKWKANWCHYFNVFYLYDVKISTCFGPTGPSSGDSQSCWHNSVSVPFWSRMSSRPERYGYWTNGCVNSCVNLLRTGQWAETCRDFDVIKIKYVEIVTLVGFSFHFIYYFNLQFWCLLNVSNPRVHPQADGSLYRYVRYGTVRCGVHVSVWAVLYHVWRTMYYLIFVSPILLILWLFDD